jgi:RHS repeat-associated protein
MKLMNKWFCLGITVLWATNGLAQPANNNGGSPGAFDEQQQARDLTGKRGQQQVDLFTGSFGYSIPINCAPARNGSEPALALVYSSGGDNGWCGMGWKLDIGYIERNTKDGFPIQFTTASIPTPGTAYDDSKGFLMNLFGKELKLFSVATNGSTVEYRAETDTDFLRCFLDTSNNKWTVYDKSGNAYYFGQTSSSRVANPKTGWSGYSGTFHWALDEVDTATGDQTTVAYTTYTGPDSSLPERTLYPTSITYNSHASVNGYGATYTGQNTISFGTEIRPDRRVSYRWGFRTEQNRRLTNIVCQVGSQKVWRYAIGYTTSKATERSLLSTLTVYGSDDTTALPTQTFTYQQNLNGVSFGPTMEWTNMNLADPTTSGATDPYVTQVTGSGITIADLFDIDGDGLPDRVSWNGLSSPNAYQVQHNNGSGFGNRYSFGPSSSGGGTTASDSNPVPDGGYYSALNGGYARMRDINGDGLPDRVDDYWKHFSSIYYATTPYTNFAVMLNTGSGFGSASMWPLATNDLGNDPNTYMSVIESGQSQPYVGLFDINGDGLPDRVMALYNQPEIYFKVQFNTGTNFMPVKLFGPYRSQNYTNSTFGIPWSGIESAEAHMVDINGDGLPDRLMYPMNPSSPGNELPYPATYYAVEFNDGYSFEATNTSTAVPGAADVWSGVATETPNGGIRFDAIWDLPYVGLYDVNGDGLPDRVMVDWTDTDYANTKWLVYLNNGRGFDTSPIVVSNIENQGNWTRSSPPTWWSMQGSDSSGTITTLTDINGDGLLDRVMKVFDNGFNNASTKSNFFLVQLNDGPFPDLLTNIANGIGGTIGVTYKPSTAYDNSRVPGSPNLGSELPFPMQTVATVTEADGINPARTTGYGYAGGFYDGVRREFHGFAMVTVTNPPSPIAAPYNRRTVYYFHQGGGQSRTNLGEYLDPGNFAKDGMEYRIETYGNDNNLYHVTVNQVNQASLGNARYFPFTQLTFECDYPGGGTPNVTATRFVYDTSTGNLTNKIEYGKVTGFDPSNVGSFPFSDADGTDTRYYNTHFTTIGSYIVDHPDKATLNDANNNVVQETDYSYNSQSGTLAAKLTRISTGYYATNSFGSYNSYGLPTLETNAVGVVTEISYDSAYTYPATTRIRAVPGSDSGNDLITTTSYDARSGLLTGLTDPAGVTVTNTYDVFSRLKESDKIPVGGGSAVWMKKVGYNLGVIGSGNAVSYIDETNNDGVGGVESRTYVDGFERPIQMRTQGENGNYRVISTTYDERGQVFLTTWPSFGTAISFSKPTSQTAAWTGFDAAGRVATNRLVSASFDANGAFSSKTDLTGDTGSPLAARTWSYVNGTDPWWVVCTDQDGKVRRYGLDAFGRTNQIQEVDGANTYITTNKFDLADNLTNIVNQNNENIYFAFDNAGGMVAMADPYLGQWTYQRDYAGRLRVQTDGRGNVIKLYYTNPAGNQDPLGRVQRKEIYSLNYTNQVLTLVSTVTNIYDSSDDGNYTVYPGLFYKMTDSQGWEKNGYDSRGRLVKTTRHLNIIGQDYTTGYTYNDGDYVASTAYPNGGPVITNAYWNGGSIKQVSRVGGSGYYYTVAATGFDEFGHVTSFAYGNTLTTTRSYYSASKRLQTISCGSVFSRSFTYTAGDDIASLSGTGITGTMSVTYDNLHRVKTYSGLSGSYGFDPVGSIQHNIEGGGSDYGYGVRRPQAVKSAFGATNLYDLCGNMIVRHAGGTNVAQALVYDAENRLVRVAQAGTNFLLVEFGYAGDGTRLWKWDNQSPTNVQVWIGNIYEEKGGKTLFHVFAGNEQVCTFEPTSVLNGGSVSTNVGYYYHEDNLNSSSALSSSGGTQLEVDSYYPFGRTMTASPQASFKVSRQFTGQVKDDETGLYYYGSGPYGRYYDPELGRFIQADTIIPDLSNPQSYNRYSYCVNNPLRYTDPTGHDYVGDVGSMFVGYYQAGAGLVTGTAFMVAHPITTAQGIGTAVAHPVNTVSAIGSGIAKDWNSGAEGQGRVVGGALLAIGSVLAPGAEAGNLSKVGEVANAGEKAAAAAESPTITAGELAGKSAAEIRQLAEDKGLNPHPTRPDKWMDPATGKERLRLDPGHVDKTTGQPFNDPNAAVPHAHGYGPEGSKNPIVNPENGNKHFPTTPSTPQNP